MLFFSFLFFLFFWGGGACGWVGRQVNKAFGLLADG